MKLRFAWIFGFVSTREYSARVRAERFGPDAGAPIDGAMRRLERSLAEDRLAVVLFLIAVGIVTYTVLYAPLFRQY